MSGGSFDYVSIRDLETPGEEHDNIVAALAKFSPAGAEVAADLMACLASLRAAQTTAAETWTRYREVLRAVEWEQSGDGGTEEIADALRRLKETT